MRALFFALLAVLLVACGDQNMGRQSHRELERYDRIGQVVTGQRVSAVIEPTAGPWFNQNTYGDKYDGPFPLSEGIVVGVMPKNDRLYGPPAVHSVQLARGDNAPAQNADVRALVQYGTGGLRNSFLCDWLHGAQFALVCNQLSVSAVTYAPIATVDYDPESASLFLGASVAKGDVSKGDPLSFTEARETLTPTGVPGAILDYPLRDFVRRVSVLLIHNDDPAVPTGVTVEFIVESGAVLAAFDAQVCAGGESISVPGGAVAVKVVNTTASDVPHALQWTLGL